MGSCVCSAKKMRHVEVINTLNHEQLKQAGNELYKQGKYEEAIIQYSKAIKVKPDISIYYSNRALCYYKMRDFSKAFSDSNSARTLDNNNLKALVYCIKSKGSEALEGNLSNLEQALDYCKLLKTFKGEFNDTNKEYCKNLKNKIKSLFTYIQRKNQRFILKEYYSKVLPKETFLKLSGFFQEESRQMESLMCPLTIVIVI